MAESVVSFSIPVIASEVAESRHSAYEVIRRECASAHEGLAEGSRAARAEPKVPR